MLMLRSRRLLTVPVALVVLGAAVALSLAGHSRSALSAPTSTETLRQTIPALDRPARPADAPPLATVNMIADHPDVDRSAIRAFATADGTGYLVPRDNKLCIAVPDPVDGYGMSCAPTASALKQGVSVMLFDAAHYRTPTIALALPAGATATAIRAAGAQTRLSPGPDAVITGRLPSDSHKIHINGPAGSSDIPLPAAPPSPPTQPVGVVRNP